MRKKFWKRVLSAFTAATITASAFAAFSMPAMADEIVAGSKSLTASDVELSYYYGAIADKYSITVGDAITEGGDYNKLANLMDGVADSDDASKECYIGSNGTNNRYIIVDLGENHKDITEMKVTNMSNAAIIGLTNTVAETGTIELDYFVRANGSNEYNPNNLGIQVNSAASPLNSANKSDATLTGDAIKNYRYIILHCNNGAARLAELTLSYKIETQKSLTASDVELSYYYGALADKYSITVGNAITSGGDYNKLANLMDGSVPVGEEDPTANNEHKDTECYIGNNGTNNRYIIVDLGEEHEDITEIKVTNMSNAAIIGLTNTIATEGTIKLDYSVRANGSNEYNPNNLGIQVNSAASPLNSANKSDATLTGDVIKDYRYIILHSNNGAARVHELTLSYDVIPVGAVTMLTSSGGKKYYDDFNSAAEAASAGDTITLLDDAVLSSQIIFQTTQKDITIEGNNHTINNNGNLLEFPNGCGTVTMNDLTITGTGNLNIAGGTVINTSNSTISNLQLGGSSNSKGTLTNSTITTLKTYGKISLASTTVENVEFLNIKGGDQPEIIGDAASSITGTVTFAEAVQTANITFPYTLFSGEMTKPNINLTGTVFEEGYTYADGVIAVAAAPTYQVNVSEGITTDKANAEEGEEVTLTVTNDNYVANSLTASYEPYAHNLPWGGTTDAPYSLQLTAAGNNTYTFTMPADDVDVTALFKDNNEIVVASHDQVYKKSTYAVDSWHYISTGEEGNSYALGFDLNGIENIADKTIKLKLQKQAGAPFTQTSARLATSNPWANGTFGEFTKAENKLATVTQAQSDIVEFEFSVSSTDLISNYLYLNVEMDEGGSGNDYYGIRSDSVHGAKQAPQAQYLPQLIITEKADSTFPTVDTQSGTYGQTLADVQLPNVEGGTLSWADSTEALAVDKNEYDAVFTPTDTIHNKNATGKITVNVAQAKEDTPTGLGIDYVNETITGLTAGVVYLINGTEVTPTDTTISVTSYIPATEASASVSVVKKATDANHANSDAATVTVPKRPDAPAGLSTEASAADGNDGKITGLDSDKTYEYMLKTAESWTTITGVTEIDNLAAGDYFVRIKAGEQQFASTRVTVSVNTKGTFTVKFVDGDGNELQSVTVNDGDDAPAYTGSDTPTKTATAQYTYTFNDTWTRVPEGTTITANTTFTANFDSTVNKYDITWQMGNNSPLVEKFEYDAMPVYNNGATPAKEADEKYTYSFSAWSPELTKVVGPATYTALFNETPKTYTITLVPNGATVTDGNTITHTYNTSEALPTADKMTYEGYTFEGWYDNAELSGIAVTNVPAELTENKTYYAKWTAIPVKTYEASIGETQYEKLTEAIGAVQDGQTIKLLKNADVSSGRVTVNANNKAFTIEADTSKTITVANNQNNNGGFLVNANGGKTSVTFKNIDITTNGGTGNAVCIEQGNAITVENGTITGNVIIKKGTLNLNGAALENELVAFNTDVTVNADADTTISSLTIASAYSAGAATLADSITAGTIAVKKSGDKPLTLGNTTFNNTGYELYVTSKGHLAVKTAGSEDPDFSYKITVDDSIKGKISVDSKAESEDTVAVTVSGKNYVENSLIAVYADNSNVLSLTNSGNTYTFTMPATDVTLYALFDDDETTTIIASDDYCYNVQAKSANKGHYIRNESDADEKNMALGFDIGDLDITDKIVKLQIVKTGYSDYTTTQVNVIEGNPWENGSFNYTLASGATKNAVVIEDGANAQYYKCTYTLDSSKLTKVGNKLYLNIERAEQISGQKGNDYYAIPTAEVENNKKAIKAEYLPMLIITEPKYYDITAREGVTAKDSDGKTITKAVVGSTVTLSAYNIVDGSLLVKSGNSVIETTKADGTYTFTMPDAAVSISGLVNTDSRVYVVPTSVERVNDADNSGNNNYYIGKGQALGMTFEIPEIPDGQELESVSLHFTRQNGAPAMTTNIYDQTNGGFTYNDGEGYIAQYNGNTVSALTLKSTPANGTYKLLFAYDSSVADNANGNDYYVVGANNSGCLPKDTTELPYLIFKYKASATATLPPKEKPTYDLQTDTQNNTFQYHFAGGTTAFMNGESEEGKAYDAYLWVPQNVKPGELKGLVAIKMNLIEVPFVYSQYLRDELTKDGFGILFLLCQKDPYGYNNTLNGFYTRKDYEGKNTIYTNDDTKWTTDGEAKDAAQIMDEILAGIAKVSGYNEIADTVPLITIGHSAASGFGNKSANWNKNRVIAQVHMKNGMSGEEAMVPGVPQLQYAGQYTEHSNGADRDRSVRDARYHIRTKRAVNSDYLVSHIIEWGSGHYDWSDNATYILTEYIKKAIEYRLPDDYDPETGLNDLTKSGYLMKPFERDGNGEERDAGYYRDYLQGWLSSGQNNSAASKADKEASFWFFDEDLANKINKFTNYAIPESPDSIGTGVSGKTYSDNEPFMLMKNPSESTWVNPDTDNKVIAPLSTFDGGMSRYGSKRFINYTRMENPTGGAIANLKGYDTATVDTYYMKKIPSNTTTTNGNTYVSYEDAGKDAKYPENVKTEFVPLVAPYEVVSSEMIDMDGMTKAADNAEANNVASVTRTTLRYHNDRVYYRSGNAAWLGSNYYTMDMFGSITSPEIRDKDGYVTSPFKVTSSQMNVPYVTAGNGRTTQTLKLNDIEDVNINGVTENPKFDITYTSSDNDLQKYTDVFVEYGPAKAVRTVNETDGSYSWQIEVLLDQIPEDAESIEVNVVASNLGKWEKTTGAIDSKTFNIVLGDPELDSVTVTPYSGVYDTQAHDAVTLSGTNADDKITYTLDGENVNGVPQITDAKEYTVTVQVEREGYKPFKKEVKAVISKAQITDVSVTGYSGILGTEASRGVTVTAAEGDTVTYKADDATEFTSTAPSFTEGEHSVTVKIHRNDNYEDYEKTVTVKITEKPVIGGIVVTPYSGEYTGEPVDAVTVTGCLDGDTVTYKLNDGEFTDAVPQITEEGTYKITVKITRDGYEDYTETVTVTISKQGDSFDEDYAPEAIQGVTEYEESTPLNGWFSNNAANNASVNTVKTENGKLVITNGESGNGFSNLWVGKRYAEQEDAAAADRIILNFEYTPGNLNSRIYLMSVSRSEIAEGIDSSSEGAYKTAADLGLSVGTTYDIEVVIDNSDNTAEFKVTDKTAFLSLFRVTNLTLSNLPDATNTAVFRPAVGAEDIIDNFSAELYNVEKPQIVIGDIDNSESDKTTVVISIENPTDETANGVLVAALYDSNNACQAVKSVKNGKVEFSKATSGYVKVFLWNSFGGMKPILDAQTKPIN